MGLPEAFKNVALNKTSVTAGLVRPQWGCAVDPRSSRRGGDKMGRWKEGGEEEGRKRRRRRVGEVEAVTLGPTVCQALLHIPSSEDLTRFPGNLIIATTSPGHN